MRSSRSSAETPSTRSSATTPRPRSRSAAVSRARAPPSDVIRPILRYGEEVLHQPAQVVPAITDEVRQLIDDMIQTMYAAPGIGLAATQVGVPLRVFVVDLSVGRNAADLMVFVNPDFVEREG